MVTKHSVEVYILNNIFSRLKGHMETGGQYPGGRYMAMVLAEVFRDSPGFARQVLGIDHKDFDVELERPVGGRSQDRRADLVLLERATRNRIAMIEVKYEDEKTAGTAQQIRNYVKQAKKRGFRFLLLSKNAPERNVLKLLNSPDGKYKYMSYADLYRAATKHQTDYPTTALKLFCDFLKEETPVFDETKIDKNALMLLLVRGLGQPHAHGLGRLRTRKRVVGAIDVLKQLVGNVQVLADRFHDDLRLSSNRPSVSFSFYPYFNLDKTHKRIAKTLEDKNNDDNEMLDAELSTGGLLEVSAWQQLRTKKGQWLTLVFGVFVELDRWSKNSKIVVSVMAGIVATGYDDDNEEDILSWVDLSKEKQLYSKLREVIRKMAKNALKDDSFPAAHRSAVKKLISQRF